MALTKTEKETELQDLEKALSGAESAILLDYRGLNVPQVTELRRQVRAVHGKYRVVKNTLARRALKGTSFEPLSAFCASRHHWSRCICAEAPTQSQWSLNPACSVSVSNSWTGESG